MSDDIEAIDVESVDDKWALNGDTVWSVGRWAVDMGEMSTADEVLSYFEKPWHWPEWYVGWRTDTNS